MELGAAGDFITCVGDDVFGFGSFGRGGWGHRGGRDLAMTKNRGTVCGIIAEGEKPADQTPNAGSRRAALVDPETLRP